MASPSRVALPSSEPAFSLLLRPKQDTPVMSLNSSDVSSSWSRVCRRPASNTTCQMKPCASVTSRPTVTSDTVVGYKVWWSGLWSPGTPLPWGSPHPPGAALLRPRLLSMPCLQPPVELMTEAGSHVRHRCFFCNHHVFLVLNASLLGTVIDVISVPCCQEAGAPAYFKLLRVSIQQERPQTPQLLWTPRVIDGRAVDRQP